MTTDLMQIELGGAPLKKQIIIKKLSQNAAMIEEQQR